MKKLTLGALILVVLMSATITANAEGWKTYANKKSGYSIEYPDIYDDTEEDFYDNGSWEFDAFKNSGGGRDSFSVFSFNNDANVSPKSDLKIKKKMIKEKGHVIIPDTEKIGKNFYSIEYYLDGSKEWINHFYGLFTKKLVIKVDITYPSKDAKKFVEITDRVEKSLKLADKKAKR